MSTIATPRDPIPRRTASSSAALTANTTPSSSARPSLDIPPSSATTSPIPSNPAKRNRAALREYYNLRSQQQSQQQQLQTPLIIPPTITTSPPPPSSPSFSSSPPQPIDLPSFNPQTFINQSLETSSLSDLLRLYTRVLSEIRALDAEKKALVYDNYSKLITATETIRKMRTTMDPLNPMAGTLDLVVERVYKLAEGLRGDMRKELAEKPKLREEGEEAAQKKKKEDTRRLAREAIKVPGRLRKLVEEGREEEARKEWELPRRLLVSWKEKGLGGDDVQRLIEEGDMILESGTGSVGDRSEVGSENRGEV